MPTVTISIAQEADDGRVLQLNSVGYPPTGPADYFEPTDEPESARHNVGGGTPYWSFNALLKFNITSAVIPANATVTAATLRVYVLNAVSADLLNFTMDYFTWSGSASDWTSTPGTNAHAGTDIASGIQNIQRDFDFALSNVNNININGYTYLRGHVSQRASNATPTGLNTFQFAGYGNANPEARLLVTYTLPATRLAPDAIVLRTNLPNVDGVAANDATALAAIDEDPDSGGTDWLTV